VSRAGPEALRSELEARGLILLAVSAQDAERFTVYLHGAAAQWVNGEAQLLAASVPGVVEVRESSQSPSILLVRMQTPPAEGPRRG
jgi:hypothetical protein